MSRSTLSLLVLLGAFCLCHQSATALAAITATGNIEPSDLNTWDSSTDGIVGNIANGTLSVNNGSGLFSQSCAIGYTSGATGEVTVDGSGSSWTNSDMLMVGGFGGGQGKLNITGGGVVNCFDSMILGTSLWPSRVTVAGNESSWINNNNLIMENLAGGCEMQIEDRGLVSVGRALFIDGQGAYVNMSTDGMLAIYGEADSSITDFLDLVAGSDAIRYWNSFTSDWADITSATYGDDYTLSYFTEGDLAGYTLLTVKTVDVSETVFNASENSDFNNLSNWTYGLPGNGKDGIVEADAVMSDIFNTATGVNVQYHMTINAEMRTGAHEFQHRCTSYGHDVRVGYGDGNSGTLIIENGGRLDIAGAGSDLFIGKNSGTGSVIFEDGSNMEVNKAIEVLNGSLHLADGMAYSTYLKDELVIGDDGELAFEIDAAGGLFAIIPGGTLAVELGANSTLSLVFTSTPTLGQTFDLITDVTGFSGVVGGSGTGVFGNVNTTGLGPDQTVLLHYLVNSFQVEITDQAIPGDANFDGVVNDVDAAILATNWQTATGATWAKGDFNGDGMVNDIDATLMATNWGASGNATVPEPSTITLLLCGLASLALLRRRRSTSH